MRRIVWAIIAALGMAFSTAAQTYIAGTSYSSEQHYGSCGRMIGVDSLGFVQVVWMKLSATYPTGPRHVFWNRWEPAIQNFTSLTGIIVDSRQRAGFACLAVSRDGWCYPAFHGSYYTGYAAYGGIDLWVGAGIFMSSHPTQPLDFPAIYHPRIAMDANGKLHMLSVSFLSTTGDSCLLYYSRATPIFDEEGHGWDLDWEDNGTTGFFLVDTSQGLRHDIAASRQSLRVARAWGRSNLGIVDLYVQISEDGGFNWGEPDNLTLWIPPDSVCYAATGNARCCSRDTLRLGSDLSLLFDGFDQLQVAFTTVAYYHFPLESGVSGEQPTKAILWDWSEMNSRFSAIAESWIEDSLLQTDFPLQSGHSMIERPSLAVDTVTGHLYCSYIRYDTSAWSESGRLNGDVFVSISTDNGMSWSEGTNVTNTRPAVVPAPNGQGKNEQDATLSECVVDDRLHLFYCMDQSGFDDEPMTLNPMIYRRVPVDSIGRELFWTSRPLHVEVVECDTITAVKPRSPVAREFALEAPYPNPFNSRTVFSFSLPVRARVRLRVFDVLGREVETVCDGVRDAGTHSVEWQPVNLGSGVYFVRLESDFGSRLQKVVYLR